MVGNVYHIFKKKMHYSTYSFKCRKCNRERSKQNQPEARHALNLNSTYVNETLICKNKCYIDSNDLIAIIIKSKEGFSSPH